jgi:hypothetical protein
VLRHRAMARLAFSSAEPQAIMILAAACSSFRLPFPAFGPKFVA